MNNILTISLLYIILSVPSFADELWFTPQSKFSLDCGPANAVMNVKWKYPTSTISIESIKKNNRYWSLDDIHISLKNNNVYSNNFEVNEHSIISHLKMNHNVIINVDMTRTRYSNVYKYGKNYFTPWFNWSHFLTISGYEYKDNRLYFIVQDSWTKNGSDVKYLAKDITRMIKYRYALYIVK